MPKQAVFFTENLKTQRYFYWYLSAALAGLMIGIWLTYRVVNNADIELRKELLEEITTIETTLDWHAIDKSPPAKVNLLETDIIAFRHTLRRACKADDECKSIYVMYQTASQDQQAPDYINKNIIFLIDSLEETDPAYGVPRTIYDEASKGLRSVFLTNKGYVSGPQTDKYGDWVTASVAHITPKSGKTNLVIAVDIDAKDWLKEMRNVAATPLIATIAYLIIIFGLLLLHAHSEREKQHLINAEKIVRHASQHDSLTDLPNRLLLNDRLKQACIAAVRNTHSLAVLFIDLDGFKSVNDQYGHEAGDALLEEVAKRLKATVREEDTVARVGGDEFVILLPKVQTEYSSTLEKQINLVTDKVIKSMNTPFHIGYLVHEISASIGVVIYPSHTQDVQMLVSFADQAMYVSKQKGKNQVQFYEL